MTTNTKKVVFTAKPEQLAQIRALVKAGKYPTVSKFLREAIDDRLEAIRRRRLEDQVERFCEEPRSEDDIDLIEVQAFGEEDQR